MFTEMFIVGNFKSVKSTQVLLVRLTKQKYRKDTNYQFQE